MMKKVHIGQIIEQRLREKRMTKTEFARRLGMPQQNINRILEDDAIKTDKLSLICDILDYNFFKEYVSDNPEINVLANGDSSIAAVNSEVNASDCALLRERVRYLEQILAEKERLIRYLMDDKENRSM